nr:hypothetical protein Iba_scaffold14370CG0850 [Ipomoea batatas]
MLRLLAVRWWVFGDDHIGISFSVFITPAFLLVSILVTAMYFSTYNCHEKTSNTAIPNLLLYCMRMYTETYTYVRIGREHVAWVVTDTSLYLIATLPPLARAKAERLVWALIIKRGEKWYLFGTRGPAS